MRVSGWENRKKQPERKSKVHRDVEQRVEVGKIHPSLNNPTNKWEIHRKDNLSNTRSIEPEQPVSHPLPLKKTSFVAFRKNINQSY